jgi:hypothetical protein
VINKKRSFLLLIIAFVFFTNSQLHAQTAKRDSILNAIKIKRTQDSLTRVETRLQFQKQKDSLLNAIKAKRTADSLGRVALVKERINDRKKQDSIIAFKKKFAQDSIDASKKGITITLKDLLQEKENEKIRLKKLEEKIAKQKSEDSTFWAVKTIKEKEEKRIQDSITTENLKIAAQKQKALLVEQKRIQDSIVIAKQIEEENLRIANEKMVVEQKRIQDSIVIAKQIEEENLRIANEKMVVEQKRVQDSIVEAKQVEEENLRIAKEKMLVEEKGIQDTIVSAKQLEKDNQRIAKEKMLVEEKGIQDSIVSTKQLEKENQRIAKAKLLVEQKRIQDSIKYANSNLTIKPKIKDNLLSVKDPIQKKATLISFNFGLSNYLGDLGGNSNVGKKFFSENNFKKQTYIYGFSLTKVWREALGLRLSFNAGTVAGSDSDVAYEDPNDNAYYSYKRNLDFTTKLSEWSAMIEIRPYKFLNRTKGLFKSALQPYGLLGIGKFKFNPQGSYYDEISQDYVFVDLAPLKTEGQGMAEYANRKPYKLNQTNIPFGFGINYLLGAKTSMSFEFVGRKLFTDYLDDVSTTFVDPGVYANYFLGEDLEIAQTMTNKSNIIDPNNPYGVGAQRGNSKNNDFYYSFNVKLNIQINKTKRKVLK